MPNTVTVIEDPETHVIEVITPGPKGDKGFKGDVGDVNPLMPIILAATEAARDTSVLGASTTTAKAAAASISEINAALSEAEALTAATTATNQAAIAITHGSIATTQAELATTKAIQTALDAASTTALASQVAADREATDADRTQTVLDRISTTASAATAIAQAATATSQASIAVLHAETATTQALLTAADRVQTGADRAATVASAATTTTQAGLAAADRIQTGLDRIATTNSAANAASKADIAIAEAEIATAKAAEALTSANNAQAAASSISGGPVTSVNDHTGVVVLAKTDLGLSNVDNTADADKPVSTAQATADTAAQNAAIAASTPIAHVGAAGTVHAVATATVAGFMQATDKVKLDAITGINSGDQVLPTLASLGAQASLVSGTNIKTLNGGSLLGAGNIVIDAAPGLVPVTGTSQAMIAGKHYVFQNIAASAGTLPTAPVAGDTIYITVGNGLLTNTFDVGTKTLRGPAASATGVITMNKGGTVQLRYVDDTTMWVML